jgi:MFS family permease
MFGYLVLFGPLVLVPIVLTGAGSSALHAGLVLTALPAGFALAASIGDKLLPHSWTDRSRAAFGAFVTVAALVALSAAPKTAAYLVPLLAVLGWGLGAFAPANNSLVMKSFPTHGAGTGGGLLNMARSLGTALGVAAVTIAVHLRPTTTGALNGASTAFLVLTVAAVGMVLSARTSHHSPDPPES